jgi:hypothetical protein
LAYANFKAISRSAGVMRYLIVFGFWLGNLKIFQANIFMEVYFSRCRVFRAGAYSD